MTKARRRTKGQGSVYESPKGSGRWWAKMPNDGPGTPAKWRVADKRAGEALLEQKRRERDDGITITGRTRTVQQLVDHYIADVFTKKENVREEYESIARNRIYPQLGSLREDEIKPTDVRTWMKKLSKTYARNSVRNAFVLLRAAFAVAVNDRLVKFNPTDGVKLPEADDDEDAAEAYALTSEEANRLLAHLEQHRLYALFYLALATGMRQGELIGLRIKNIMLDGDNPGIRVVEQVQLVRNQPVFQTAKTKKSRRFFPIDPDTIAVLRQHLVRLLEEQLQYGRDWNPDGLFFPSTEGTPLRGRNLYRLLKETLKKAAFPEDVIAQITFHSLRHSAASLMLAAGCQAFDVAAILGHDGIEMIARIYGHSYDDKKRAAVATVTQHLRRIGGIQ